MWNDLLKKTRKYKNAKELMKMIKQSKTSKKLVKPTQEKNDSHLNNIKDQFILVMSSLWIIINYH